VAPVTQINYDDAYDTTPPGPTFAFPKTIIRPGSLTTSATYFYQLGRIKSFTDPNSNLTSCEYGENDDLDRLTKVSKVRSSGS